MGEAPAARLGASRHSNGTVVRQAIRRLDRRPDRRLRSGSERPPRPPGWKPSSI